MNSNDKSEQELYAEIEAELALTQEPELPSYSNQLDQLFLDLVEAYKSNTHITIAELEPEVLSKIRSALRYRLQKLENGDEFIISITTNNKTEGTNLAIKQRPAPSNPLTWTIG